jgi:tetratricopeptide (TPR) repeat protein
MAAPKQDSPYQATAAKDDDATAASLKPASPQDPPAVRGAPSGPPSTPAQQTSTENNLQKDAPGGDATEHFEDPPDLTYAGTEASDAYLLAKRLLADGDFDQAMDIIAAAMASTMSRLPEESSELHECMGPFYYLYGTTLLYSIEESATGNFGPEEHQGEDDADDAQIAWENLDTSRVIVTKMREDASNDDKLTLDLAQIHMRLGDVQKANNRAADALEDYRRALELRQPLLGMYNSKVADLYMQTAMTYMTMASAEGLSRELKGDYTNKALEHYLACGKSFAGLIAFTCGHDPELATKDVDTSVGVGKTSGMTEEELRVNQMSLTLKVIRERVETMGTDDDQVQEWKEILMEIHETIDEAERAGKAMAEVMEMKVQAMAAADADGEIQNIDGSTTTFGFGGEAAAAATANLTSLDVATAAEGDAKPMMMVRKKQKRDVPAEDKQTSAQEDASKRAKTE